MSTRSGMTGQQSTVTRRGRGGRERTFVDAGGWEPWSTPVGGMENGASSSSAMATGSSLTVVDQEVLECSICYQPLKAPIFQCTVGHVACSPCYNKLKDPRKCYFCRIALPRGYQRCYAMERLVDSARSPCPHARYGCGARPAYYAREEHRQQCPHGPCHCLSDACRFVGSVTMLIRHIMVEHGWPCSIELRAEEPFGVNLCNGFNFLVAVRGSTRYLLLLNMASTHFGRTISAIRVVSSCAGTPTCNLDLSFTGHRDGSSNGCHYLKSRFQVECRCPLDCLPDPNASFQFWVPKYSNRGSDEEEDVVHVTATIITSIIRHKEGPAS